MSEATRGRSNQVLWTIIGAVGLLLIALLLLVRAMVQDLPPGTTLAGESVGAPDEALATADEVERQLSALPVRFVAGEHQVLLTAGELGATLDRATLDAAIEDRVGFDDWAERFTGGGSSELPVRISATPPDLAALAADVSSPPIDGAVTIGLGGADVTDPVDGVTVQPEAIREALVPALEGLADLDLAAWPRPLEVRVEGDRIAPMITRTAIDALLVEIERISEAPPIVTAQRIPEDAQTVEGEGPPTREEVELLLDAGDILLLLDVETDENAIARERLRLTVSSAAPPPALVEFVGDADIGPDLAITVENRSPTPPRDPGEQSFSQFTPPSPTGPGGPADQPRLADVSGITGDLVAEVIEPGLEADLDRTVRAIVEAARDGQERVAVQGREVTDADPSLLGVVEPVSTFTTFFTPGQTRNTNIARIADIVDGALIPPGANYEVNHAVGRRTAADGFVSAGAIADGEFVSDVGGGVSQFATTFFNAMWFSGVDIITFKPHSFYFERYPAGREATIDFPGVDLELNNNTPHWILVDTTTTDDSVTVTFWSTPYFEVTTGMGPRMPDGDGFTMQIRRDAVSVDGQVNDDDVFTVNYDEAP